MNSLWQQEDEALFIKMFDSCYAVKHFINTDPCGFSFKKKSKMGSAPCTLAVSYGDKMLIQRAAGCGLMRIICVFTRTENHCNIPKVSAYGLSLVLIMSLL